MVVSTSEIGIKVLLNPCLGQELVECEDFTVDTDGRVRSLFGVRAESDLCWGGIP